MEATDARDEDLGFTPEPVSVDSNVSAHRSSPDRFVFTEDGNTDGWIATDLTVELTR